MELGAGSGLDSRGVLEEKGSGYTVSKGSQGGCPGCGSSRSHTLNALLLQLCSQLAPVLHSEKSRWLLSMGEGGRVLTQ